MMMMKARLFKPLMMPIQQCTFM